MSKNGESRSQERPELDEMPEQQERQETPSLSDDDVDSLGMINMYLPTLVHGYFKENQKGAPECRPDSAGKDGDKEEESVNAAVLAAAATIVLSFPSLGTP